MERGEGELLEMVVEGIEKGQPREGYLPLTLLTSLGDVECRYYRAPEARLGAAWVGGAGGGWDSPAHGLYPRLCRELGGEGISSVRVRYRYPNQLEECALDLLAGIEYLQREGAVAVAAAGHSFGGAVAIQAAAACPAVRTVVALSTQSYGTAAAAGLGPRCSILVLHGAADRVLPAYSAEYVYRIAKEPKRVIIYPGAGHGLDEVAGEVERAVRDWIVEQLQGAVGRAGAQ